MARMQNQPEGKLEDKTQYTPAQKFLDNLVMHLNPVYAARNVRAALIRKGIIEIPGAQAWADKVSANQVGLSHDEVEAILAWERAHSQKEKAK